MSPSRTLWKIAQWLPVPFFVAFAVTCGVANVVSPSPKNTGPRFTLFAGIAIAMLFAVSNIALNISLLKMDFLVIAAPERRSFSRRKVFSWIGVALRFAGMAACIALGAVYAQSPLRNPAAPIMGFVAAAANATTMGFCLAKIYGSDRQDERRLDEVAQGQQLGGGGGGFQSQQQWGGFPSAGGQTQHGWQPVPQQQQQGPPYQQQPYGQPQQQQGWAPQPQGYGQYEQQQQVPWQQAQQGQQQKPWSGS